MYAVLAGLLLQFTGHDTSAELAVAALWGAAEEVFVRYLCTVSQKSDPDF